MKIIMTHRFKKYYLKHLEKYFSPHQVCEYLKKKEHTFITLTFPYFKFKITINGVSFRGVGIIIQTEKIIPLLIFLKKDKKHGENIKWNLIENEILQEYSHALEDIKKGSYTVFE
ncbi:hypothetical protein MK079_04090 [Candidatus Gracilibacteria bacterium]|nr:hypothetical protein [Candidatus Gracilibacteria bacterium]